MSVTDILGLIFAFIGLAGLIALLFIVTVPVSKKQEQLLDERIKLYKAINKFLNKNK